MQAHVASDSPRRGRRGRGAYLPDRLGIGYPASAQIGLRRQTQLTLRGVLHPKPTWIPRYKRRVCAVQTLRLLILDNRVSVIADYEHGIRKTRRVSGKRDSAPAAPKCNVDAKHPPVGPLSRRVTEYRMAASAECLGWLPRSSKLQETLGDGLHVPNCSRIRRPGP